ncbi:MAG: DUF4465 domain-containing protein [Dysgonomonas sp.]
MGYKKLYLIFICLLLSSLNIVNAQKTRSYDSSSGVFYLKTSDGIESYVVDGSVTFKASKDGTVAKYRDAGVCFRPKNKGDIIQITVDDIDIDGTSFYLRLYNDSAYIGSSLPSTHFAQIGVAQKGATYTSTADNGKMTIGFHSPNQTSTYTGWTITVKSISPADMEYKSASAFLDKTEVNRGGRNQVLLGANIITSGSGNPLSVKSLDFTSTIPINVIESYKVYSSGSSSSFSSSAALLGESSVLNSTISVPADLALKNGNNYFWFVANIDPNAQVGTDLPISLASVKIGDDVKIADVSSPAASAKVSGDILIQPDALTYTIGDAANFYDDGGKGGKISTNFQGTITFVPAIAGKKIKIDFSKLEIFNTSTVGYNDVLKFYNGQTVDESNLIATLLKDAKIIKSTADDGSLTVTLKSTTGVPANGWEAMVSEFVPSVMTFDSLTVSQLSSATVAGSTENEPFVLINLKTTNTLTPLVLQNIYLDATGTTNLQDLNKAKIYFLGETSTFSTTKLFGEASISGNSIQVDGNQELKEGNNYFALVYDLTSAASNGDIISVAVSKVNVSGAEKTPQTILVASRTVANIFKSLPGTYIREFHDAWTYTDTKSTINSAYYNFEDVDCSVTFKPSTPGTVTEIDFSSFDVYYSATTYGIRAAFEIYNGSTSTSDNLLWKLNDNAQSKTGPGKKLRSTAEDGSLTIKFNAKTATSAYAGKGWTALVTPFVNHDMTVKDITAFQTNSNPLKPSATNQEIVGFSMLTEGDLSTQTVKEIKVDVKNSESAINKVSILYSAGDKDFSKAVLFGSSTDLSAQEVTVTGEQELPEGLTYFWIAYDVKNIVNNDIQVDAKLVSVKTDDATPYIPSVGDPEGYRLTKNQLNLATGDNGQITIYNPILFYDDGGAENDYSLGFDGHVTFLPSETGKVVKMTFDSFQTGSSHYFYVYNGTEMNENNLVGKYSSTTFPASLLSGSADGALTVRFVSTTGYAYEGWKINVESYTPQALFVDNVTTTAYTTTNVLRGSSKAPMQKIEVNVGGDKGILKLNNFTFNNTGTTSTTDITSAGLYYTGTSSGFIADNQFGNTATNSPYVMIADNDIEISAPGTYYFWLTYDIDANAIAGNNVAVSLNQVYANGVANVSITESSVATRAVKAGFKGTYTIGKSANADYSTFASAISAMQGGIEGVVRFNVESGTYAENIKLQGIQGTSAINNIVFSSVSGNNDDVIIKGAGYSEPAYGDPKYGMVAIDSTEYVTFENISFVPTVQTYPYAVHILNTSRHFTLRNCIVTADPITTGYSGMSLFRMEARNVEGNNNDYVTVENNTFNGGYIALYMGGTSYVALTKERGSIIRNNIISNAGSKGIYLSDEQDALIDNNTVISSTTQKTGYIGLDIFRNRGVLVIRNNKIVNNQAYYSSGINLRQELMGTAETPVLVYNNSIALTASPSTSSYGIDISSDCGYIALYYNTINISGTAGYALGVSKTYETIKSILFQNNLVQNNTSSPIYYFNKQAHLNAFTFKNNAYYKAGSKFSNSWGDVFSAWATTSGETSSFEEQAQFVSNSDLRLKAQGGLNVAIPIGFIAADANEKIRSLTTPTLGAFEYEEINENKPEISDGYPKIGTITYNSIVYKTKWNQSGTLYSIIRKATETAPTEVELLAATGVSVNKDVEYSSTFTSLDEEMEYKAYFMFVSPLNVKSDIVASGVAKTLKQIFPLSVTLPEKWATITSGTEVRLYPTVSGGIYPYTYQWKNQMNEVISVDSVLIVSPTVVQQYKLIVTSYDAQTTTSYTDVPVIGQSNVATFEDNYLAPESYWQGRSDSDDLESVFYSGSYSFTNTYYPEWSYWGGFGYANLSTTSFDPDQYLTQQFRSVVGHGAENSDTYSIVYAMGTETKISVVNNAAGAIIPGVYLTNAAYTLNSMENGDLIAGDPFKQGDYYKVIFTGTTATRSTSTVECYLADYRSNDASERYMLTDWKWFDLSSLGNVTSVTISVGGSRTGDYGLNTPAYLCMDNFGSEMSTVDIKQNESDQIQIYPVPAYNVLNISATYTNYAVHVYTNQGKLMKNEQGLSGNSKIDVSALAAGSYVLEIISNEGRVVKNFIKR